MKYEFKYNKELKESILKHIKKEYCFEILVSIDKYEDENDGDYHGYIDNYENKKFVGYDPFLELNYFTYQKYTHTLGDKELIYESNYFIQDLFVMGGENMILREWFKTRFMIRYYNNRRKPNCCIMYLDLTTQEGVENLFSYINESTMTETNYTNHLIKTETTEKTYNFPNSKVDNQYRFYLNSYGFIVYEIIDDKAIFNTDVINELNKKYETYGNEHIDDIINDKI